MSGRGSYRAPESSALPPFLGISTNPGTAVQWSPV
jgi:hypothetical protein